MADYCVLNEFGNVINMVTSAKTLEQVRQSFIAFPLVANVVPVSQVPQSKLEQYQYWNERP